MKYMMFSFMLGLLIAFSPIAVNAMDDGFGARFVSETPAGLDGSGTTYGNLASKSYKPSTLGGEYEGVMPYDIEPAAGGDAMPKATAYPESTRIHRVENSNISTITASPIITVNP